MSRNVLFVIALVVIGVLAAIVAKGMFDVGTMPTFEMSKMYFAAAILAFLAFIFMLAIIVYALGQDPEQAGVDSPGKVIFDACVKVIPPMVTLIIGFYFGTQAPAAPGAPNAPNPPQKVAAAAGPPAAASASGK
jgi:hypothetical protein